MTLSPTVLSEIESEVLKVIVSMLQAEGPELAQTFLNELVQVINSYIPKSGLAASQKINWTDIRNVLEAELAKAGSVAEKLIIEDMLQAITNLIASHTKA